MNVQHRTSNVQHRMKKQTPHTEHLTTISVSFQHTRAAFLPDRMSVSSFFPIQRSMLNVHLVLDYLFIPVERFVFVDQTGFFQVKKPRMCIVRNLSLFND